MHALASDHLLSSSILLIDSDCAVRDSLHEHFSDLALDVCTSALQASTLLFNTPYQLVICGMQMALADHCLLLKQSRLYSPFAPFLVMTRSHEGPSVGQAIDEGALDLLLEPFASISNTRTVQSLLWLYRLRKQVARQQVGLTTHKARFGHRPINVDDPLIWLRLKETRIACEQTIQAIEESIRTCMVTVHDLEIEAGHRVKEHRAILNAVSILLQNVPHGSKQTTTT